MSLKTSRDLPCYSTIEEAMNHMPKYWRTRWCTAAEDTSPDGGCGCVGCANVSGGLVRQGFTKEDWKKWMEENEGQ